MKNTRKFLAAVMALAIISAMAPISASARGGEGAEGTKTLDKTTASADTNVKYSVDPSYTVVIPANVILSDSQDVTADIELDKPETFKLAKGEKLSVKIANVDSNDFTVKNGDESVNYTVEVNGNALAKGDTAAEFAEGNTDAKTLTFPKMGNAATYAGEYTGTLTFTIAVEVMSQVAVEGVSINNENVSQKVIWDEDGYANSVTEGKSAKLSVAVSPTDATNKEVEWTSSDPNIATVDDEGNVTGVSHGSVTITATAKDGSGKKDTIRLHVAKPIATGVKWAASSYKADHVDLLDFGEGVYVKSTWWGGNTTKVTGTKLLAFIWFADDHYYSAFDGFGDDYNTEDDGHGSEKVYGYEIKGSGTAADPFYGVPYHSEID